MLRCFIGGGLLDAEVLRYGLQLKCSGAGDMQQMSAQITSLSKENARLEKAVARLETNTRKQKTSVRSSATVLDTGADRCSQTMKDAGRVAVLKAEVASVKQANVRAAAKCSPEDRAGLLPLCRTN